MVVRLRLKILKLHSPTFLESPHQIAALDGRRTFKSIRISECSVCFFLLMESRAFPRALHLGFIQARPRKLKRVQRLRTGVLSQRQTGKGLDRGWEVGQV